MEDRLFATLDPRARRLAGPQGLAHRVLELRGRGALKRDLAALAAQRATLIFYESPRRLLTLLQALRDALGDRRAVLARELTKIYETVLRGTLGELTDLLAAEDIQAIATETMSNPPFSPKNS